MVVQNHQFIHVLSLSFLLIAHYSTKFGRICSQIANQKHYRNQKLPHLSIHLIGFSPLLYLLATPQHPWETVKHRPGLSEGSSRSWKSQRRRLWSARAPKVPGVFASGFLGVVDIYPSLKRTVITFSHLKNRPKWPQIRNDCIPKNPFPGANC